MKWFKMSGMSESGDKQTEKWIRKSDENIEEFDVELYLGKKTNLSNFKKNSVETIKSNLEYYKKSREGLYLVNKSDQELVTTCPVTGISVEKCDDVVNIYGAEYVKTPDTGHVFLKYRAKEKAINSFYTNDITYSTTYTNKETIDSRMNSIYIPWVNWMVEVYEKQYGKKPEKILDVGSGAGYFVEACRRAGYTANGIELSKSSRQFAMDNWNLEMDGGNFHDIYTNYEGYDIVTFWGLLEHTTDPSGIVEKAHNIVSKSQNGGMIISKVPRIESLSSAVQILNPNTILRHMDPLGHIMIFSDASISELYYKNKFVPTVAWYYGMDLYETLMQFGNRTGEYTNFFETSEFQVELQQYIDEQRFSDGIVLVGVPRR